MNNKISAVVGFVAGVGAGFAGCYVWLKRKNEKRLSEEVESIKNTYEKINGVDASANKPDDIQNQRDIDEHYNEASKAIIIKTNKENESKDEEESDEEDSEEDSEEDLEYDDEDDDDISEYKQIVMSYGEHDSIMLITEEDYEDTLNGYDKREVMYYDDGEEQHCIDVDTGHEMDNWVSELGYEEGLLNDSLFSEYAGIVYIRNDYLSTDYLVSKSSVPFM